MFDPNTDNVMDYGEAKGLIEKAAENAHGLTRRDRENLPFALATVRIRERQATVTLKVLGEVVDEG